jgi:thiosulfate dehydrogenase [quinone] large subunit
MMAPRKSEAIMTTINPNTVDVLVEKDIVTHQNARRGLAVLRIAFGVTFLWAFFDKLLALGYATGKNPETGAVDRFGPDAWINEGNPTFGFLSFGVSEDNWFHGFFTGIAGDSWTNWLFMLGLAGIGFALITGLGIRLAAITGTVLYLMMYAASFPLENNPVVDDHLSGAIVLIVLGLTLAGDTWGFGKTWAKTNIVRRFPVLR